MTEILIWPKKLVGTTEDGVRLQVYPLRYERNDEYIDIYDVSEAETLDFTGFKYIKGLIWSRFVSLPLPHQVAYDIGRNLFHYLQEHGNDCYDFVNDVYEVPRHEKERGCTYWKWVGGISSIRPGDAVFFLDTAKELFFHAAVYLGDGLCLSVHGKNGTLGVSRLQDTARDYSAPHICKMERLA